MDGGMQRAASGGMFGRDLGEESLTQMEVLVLQGQCSSVECSCMQMAKVDGRGGHSK